MKRLLLILSMFLIGLAATAQTYHYKSVNQTVERWNEDKEDFDETEAKSEVNLFITTKGINIKHASGNSFDIVFTSTPDKSEEDEYSVYTYSSKMGDERVMVELYFNADSKLMGVIITSADLETVITYYGITYVDKH
jgi:hypothetical protein